MKTGEIYAKGKTKTLYCVDGADKWLAMEFRDDITAFNRKKADAIPGKGRVCCAISSLLMRGLGTGVPTHFLLEEGDARQFVLRAEPLPLEIVARNHAAGSFASRFGVRRGKELSKPFYELFYKNDKAGDPAVSWEHVRFFEWMDEQEIERTEALAEETNLILREIFKKAGICLVDFKMEF